MSVPDGDLDRLLEAMEDLRALLDRHGVSNWAEWVERDIASLRRGERRGLNHFLSAFGGMGSLNDLIICPENGHRISRNEAEDVNRRLGDARSRAHALASALMRRTE